MRAHDPKSRVLCALLALSQEDETIDLFSISEEAGLNLYRTLRELAELGDTQLICPRRLRLTATGLALAAALRPAAQPSSKMSGALAPRAAAADSAGASAQQGRRALASSLASPRRSAA